VDFIFCFVMVWVESKQFDLKLHENNMLCLHQFRIFPILEVNQ